MHYNNVPKSFRSNAEINARYLKVRPEFYPFLRSKARVSTLEGCIDSNDLLQELEMIALYGVSKYDPSRGRLLTWIGHLVDRTVNEFLTYGATWKRRSAQFWDEVGDAEAARMIAASAEDYYLNHAADLAAQEEHARFRAATVARLSGLSLDLFWARTNPPVELLIFVRNKIGRPPEAPEQISLRMLAEYFEVPRAEVLRAWAEVEVAAGEAGLSLLRREAA